MVAVMSDVQLLKRVSFAEGLSYLALLLIAMPVMYLLDEPLAVRIVGSLHGLLTVILLAAAARVANARTLPLATLAFVLVLSLVPLGFLVADRTLEKAAAS